MTRAQWHLRFRLCLAILPVLLLLASTWVQASVQITASLAVEICSDGIMKTVQIDGQEEGQGPQDCRKCPACVLSASPGRDLNPDLSRPSAWLPAAYLQPAERAVPPQRTAAPLSRGPPVQPVRHPA